MCALCPCHWCRPTPGRCGVSGFHPLPSVSLRGRELPLTCVNPLLTWVGLRGSSEGQEVLSTRPSLVVTTVGRSPFTLRPSGTVTGSWLLRCF